MTTTNVVDIVPKAVTEILVDCPPYASVLGALGIVSAIGLSCKESF